MTNRLKPIAGVRCASGMMLRLPQTDSVVMHSLEKLYAAWGSPFSDCETIMDAKPRYRTEMAQRDISAHINSCRSGGAAQ